MRLTFRPLGADWQGEKTPNRKSAHYFRADWSSTLGELERELSMLKADGCVIQLDLAEADLRLDGSVRADAKVLWPGVIVSFEAQLAGQRVPLRYQCDRFQTWRHNVRAIALGLEALRKVESYGIASRGEQYQGWAALPPSSGAEEGIKRRFASPAEAAIHVAKIAGIFNAGDLLPILLADKEYFDDLFKRAAKKFHPDAGGDRSEWETLVEARKVVENNRQAQAITR